MAVTHIVLPLATINGQGVSDPRDAVLYSSILPLPGIALAFYQEVSPIRFILRARLATRLIGVHQAKAIDKGGVALVWDKTRLESGKRGYVLLARPEPGDDMRKRYGAWVDLRVKGTPVIFRALSAHRPLRSTGDQPEFDWNLQHFTEDSPHPCLIGLDVNGDGGDVAQGIRFMGGHGTYWRGVGIDGWLVDGDLVVGEATRLPASRSDHRALTANLRVAL